MTQPQQQRDQTGGDMNFPTVGRWLVTALPRGWLFIIGFGIKQMGVDPSTFQATISLGQDELGQSELDSSEELLAYVKMQSRLIGDHLEEAAMAGPQPTSFQGADEACLFFVRHTPEDAAKMLHAQTYVRSGRWVGIITLTTRESELKAVRPDYDAFVKGLRIAPV